MTAVAPPHEKIVVVVASQQHPVGQRGELGRRALRRSPDHTALAVRKAVGVFARILRGRVPQRGDGDGDRIDQGGFGGTLGALVELVGDIDDVIGDQLADFVAVSLLVVQRFAHELTASIVTERSSGRRTLWPIPIMIMSTTVMPTTVTSTRTTGCPRIRTASRPATPSRRSPSRARSFCACACPASRPRRWSAARAPRRKRRQLRS